MYDDRIVNKPWGHEYLLFENGQVAMWYLFIRRGECTSMHCHPRKKTGLIVLSGSATVRFLNNSSPLRAPANMMLRAGLFHQSAADLGTDVALIEIESPVDKMNLVRLDDAYGRQNTAYEPLSATRPLDATCLRLPQPVAGATPSFSLHERQLRLHRHDDVRELMPRVVAGDIVVVLEGGLFTDDGEPILTAGDAVSAATLCRLGQAFGSPNGISAIVVSSESAGTEARQ